MLGNGARGRLLADSSARVAARPGRRRASRAPRAASRRAPWAPMAAGHTGRPLRARGRIRAAPERPDPRRARARPDPVCTSTAATCASSSALASCAQDPQGCFYEASSSSCGARSDVLRRRLHPGKCAGRASRPAAATRRSRAARRASGKPGRRATGRRPSASAVRAARRRRAASRPGPESAAAERAARTAARASKCPGSTYYRTYTNSGSGPTGEADPATVSNLRLDKYLVTVGRFRQFVAAWDGGSGWTPAAGSGKHTHLHAGKGLANSGNSGSYEAGWVASDKSNIAPTNANLTSCSPSPWTNTAGSQENLPITCVNWYEAYAFCIWDGGFLPSEAEWENAAAGGTQQREYPWGSTAPGTACPGTGCSYAIYGCYYPNGSGDLLGRERQLRAGGHRDGGSGAVGPPRSGGRRVRVESRLVRDLRRSVLGLRLSHNGHLPGGPGRRLRPRRDESAGGDPQSRPPHGPPQRLWASMREDAVGQKRRHEARGRSGGRDALIAIVAAFAVHRTGIVYTGDVADFEALTVFFPALRVFAI